MSENLEDKLKIRIVNLERICNHLKKVDVNGYLVIRYERDYKRLIFDYKKLTGKNYEN